MFNLQQSVKKSFEGEPVNVEGYEEIQIADWMNIPIKSYIRYEKKNKQIVKGGFVISKAIDRGAIALQADLFDQTSAKWNVSISSILRIWKKIAASEEDNISTENIQSLARTLKALNTRVAILEQSNYPELNTPMVSERVDNDLSDIKVDIVNLKQDLKKVLTYVAEIVENVNEQL
jgi:hypothetical protein